jgi:sec-independent protein translocase protein TatB
VFNLSGSEVLFILVIGLVVLGPEKLPEMLRRAGRLYGELRRMSQGVQAELKSALTIDPQGRHDCRRGEERIPR